MVPKGPASMNEAGVVLRDLELLARFAVAFATQDPRAFEADGDTLTMDLSPVAAKLFTPLLRRRIVPIVATMVDGVCAECNVAVPTGLASSIMASRELHICLRCKRILIPLEAVQAAARRADGSAP